MGYLGLLIVVLIGAGIAGYQSFSPQVVDVLVVPAESVGTAAIDAASELAGVSQDLLSDVTRTNQSETMRARDAGPGTANPGSLPENQQTMLVAGGCFWCVEADLEKLPGVLSVVSGYAGGRTSNPTYENYASGGHREVVSVTYDTSRISYEQLLIYAMKHMDPTDDNGSFGDRGESYSPAFYYQSAAEKTIIAALIAEVNDKGPYNAPLSIDVESRPTFYAAEDYHQDYYKGTVSKLKYQYYRAASGRDSFIQASWGSATGVTLPWRTNEPGAPVVSNQNSKISMWKNYVKPSQAVLKTELEPQVYAVTQTDGTERAFTSPLDKNYNRGIYVDVLSGEPLFSSRDKFDSGTGWPSFVAPIMSDAVTEHLDTGFFSTRTEIRSTIADNHLGHVFNDGPSNRGGKRYCMNGVALRFIAEAEMEAQGYGDFKGGL